VLGSLCALPCDRHFQDRKFDHRSASFRVAVPSRNQSAPAAFVPATERPISSTAFSVLTFTAGQLSLGTAVLSVVGGVEG
jgi:hypothetical protein